MLPLIALAETLTGKPRIIDGDTLEIAGERIRLHGIDAPEAKQTCTVNGQSWACGEEATLALIFKTAEHWVRCETLSKDRYGRHIATCYVGPYDLNRWMVRNGWAIAYRYYSEKYVIEEEQALAEGLGIWRGEFIEPYKWRMGQRGR